VTRRISLSLLGVLVLAVVVGACAEVPAPATGTTAVSLAEAAADEVPGPEDPGPPRAATGNGVTLSARTAEEAEDVRPVTIAFTGDVHGERQIGEAIERGDDPLAAIAPVLGSADLTVVNVETAVGTIPDPDEEAEAEADKSYTFLSSPALWNVLAGAGVDVVNLANNHSLDFGTDVLTGMLDASRAAGLTPVGAGVDATEAYAPAVFTIGGQRIAVVGLTRVIPRPDWAAGDGHPGLASAYVDEWAADAVRRASLEADHVVVTIHWGQEGADCPDEDQLRLSEVLLDAGAAVVAGHHPHVLQAVVQHDAGLVAYSLGNFLWYTQGPVGRLTGVLTVSLDRHGVADWDLVPAIIGPDGSPEPVTGEEADAALSRLADVSPPSWSCS
jgi:hypothetical protein